jgi:hypothetical protein
MGLTTAERRNFKCQAVRAIEAILGSLGWAATAWRGNGRFFTQAELVTPYLLVSDIAGRRWGHYVIEGSFGVLHRPFEQSWSSKAESDETAMLTVGLHAANFGQHEDTRYIDPGKELQPQVASFCESAIKILSALPFSEAGLVSAVRENKLAGHSFESYLSHAAARPELKAKHLALRHYLENLRSH